MEEIKLPTVPELELIPIERRNFPEEDHKQEKIQHKRKDAPSPPASAPSQVLRENGPAPPSARAPLLCGWKTPPEAAEMV